MSIKTNKRSNEGQKPAEEHMMETFPEPRGMPIEWSLPELADTKTKKSLNEDKKALIMAKSVMDGDGETSEIKKDEAHLIETFPKPRTMPSEWHCNNCD